MSDTTPPPGIYQGIDFDEYRSWDAVNNSSLGPLRRSAAHYRAALEAERTETDALRFGTICHHGKLEPLELLRRYTVQPDLTEGLVDDNGEPYAKPKATKAYKERVAAWEAQNHDKEVISQQWFDLILGMSRALDAHSLASEWLGADGPAECSLIWQDPGTGLMCKARIDKLAEPRGMAVDLKTTRDAQEFERAIVNFGYGRQAAMYADGLRVLTGRPWRFGIIAAEKESPFGVRAAPMSDDVITAGRIEYRAALEQIAQSRQSKRWPGYESPTEWGLPAWAAPECELIVDGQIINL